MHKEIFTPEQSELLPLVAKFKKKFGLVGGTAIALHLGHRRSIDFDLFSWQPFDSPAVKRLIKKQQKNIVAIFDIKNQLTVAINEVKFTWFYYPYPIEFNKQLADIIKLPDLLTLASIKAFALGQRAKWKDYVDLYFILRDHYSVEDISRQAKKIFQDEFNEKLFRVQLAYFESIDYSEQVDYLPGQEVSEEKIKRELKKFSVS